MTTTASGKEISIAMGHFSTAKSPDVLEIRGLGSCIALALHDPLPRLAGLAHIVIPRPLPNTPPASAWAATSAVPALIEAMEREGGRTHRMIARIAGGATMFPGIRKGYDVGPENAEVVEALLRAYNLPVLSRQVGGRRSRSVFLHADDGRFDVKSAGKILEPSSHKGGADPVQNVRILLEATTAPLSDMLQRPIAVTSAARYDLTPDEIVDFLGLHTRMRWSRLTYNYAAQRRHLDLLIPEGHALRIDEELRSQLDERTEPESALGEVLNIMLSHGLTALAKLSRSTLRPETTHSERGSTRDFVATLSATGRPIRVAHARMRLEGAFHGADMAMVGEEIP